MAAILVGERQALQRWGSHFLGDEGPARVRAAYPGPTWDWLVAVKRHWDPDNLFRRNHNISPQAEAPRPRRLVEDCPAG